VTLHNTIKQHLTTTEPENFIKSVNQIKQLTAKISLVVIRRFFTFIHAFKLR